MHTDFLRSYSRGEANLAVDFDILLVIWCIVKFMSSKKATKIDEIFTVDLTFCKKCQMNCEDFVNFCGLLRKHKLYKLKPTFYAGRG